MDGLERRGRLTERLQVVSFSFATAYVRRPHSQDSLLLYYFVLFLGFFVLSFPSGEDEWSSHKYAREYTVCPFGEQSNVLGSSNPKEPLSYMVCPL